MNTTSFDFPGDEKQGEKDTGQSTTGEDVQISLPKIERPEGPFEHSGETSGWTKEEAAEKNEQDQK